MTLEESRDFSIAHARQVEAERAALRVAAAERQQQKAIDEVRTKIERLLPLAERFPPLSHNYETAMAKVKRLRAELAALERGETLPSKVEPPAVGGWVEL